MTSLIKYFDNQVLVKINEEFRERDKEMWTIQYPMTFSIIYPPFLNLEFDTEDQALFFIKSFEREEEAFIFCEEIKRKGHEARYMYKQDWTQIKSFEE